MTTTAAASPSPKSPGPFRLPDEHVPEVGKALRRLRHPLEVNSNRLSTKGSVVEFRLRGRGYITNGAVSISFPSDGPDENPVFDTRITNAVIGVAALHVSHQAKADSVHPTERCPAIKPGDVGPPAAWYRSNCPGCDGSGEIENKRGYFEECDSCDGLGHLYDLRDSVSNPLPGADGRRMRLVEIDIDSLYARLLAVSGLTYKVITVGAHDPDSILEPGRYIVAGSLNGVQVLVMGLSREKPTEEVAEVKARVERRRQRDRDPRILRRLDEYHEDEGPVVWLNIDLDAGATGELYFGSPLDEKFEPSGWERPYWMCLDRDQLGKDFAAIIAAAKNEKKAVEE